MRRAPPPRDQDTRLEAILPLPDICLAALQLRADRQAAERAKAADIWQDTGLVFTTTLGAPYEPRNFARHFALRCSKAGVRCCCCTCCCTKITKGRSRLATGL
jgi:hypothetical protein